MQPIVEMHHEMELWVGGLAQGPSVRQDCLDRGGIACEEERASRPVIPFGRVDLGCDGAAIFVVIPLGKSDGWSISSLGWCHGGLSLPLSNKIDNRRLELAQNMTS